MMFRVTLEIDDLDAANHIEAADMFRCAIEEAEPLFIEVVGNGEARLIELPRARR